MRTLTVILVSVLLAACADGAPPDAEAEEAPGLTADPSAGIEDAEVRRVHERMMEAMAPQGGWERTRYIAFDWLVDRGEAEPARRSHRWARWEGEVRVDQPYDDGDLIALFNVDRPQEGRAWLDGTLLEGETAQDALASAHRSFINDSYWFLMPYKWTDPGVHLTYLGERTDEDGRDWEVVELRFDEVGLTPQNMYQAWVNPETGLMERWYFIRDEEAEPARSEWTGWEEFGPIRVATQRLQNGVPRITFENIEIGTDVPAGAFDPPATD